MKTSMTHLALVLFAVVVLLAEAGCASKSTGEGNRAAPVEVQVVTVSQRDVPIYQEWIGTLDGYVNADIKAEVSGYLIEQSYREGTFVTKGQLLFQIDPRPFQATLDQAQGQLSQSKGGLEQARAQLSQAEAQVAVAQANQGRTQLDVERYRPLAEQQAVSQQELDNATQNNMAAQAQVVQARAQVDTAKAQITAASAAVESAGAAVETAQINLGFTRITSPIDGLPGLAQLQVGSLVNPAGGPITTVSTVDPIKVYFTVSEQEYLDFVRRFPTAEQRQSDLRDRPIELILADGIPHPYKGRFYFADRQVDVRTGAIRVAALFPNPGNSLRPGQYGRVRLSVTTEKGAVLIPQRAVNELQGIHQVAIVEPDNKVRIQTVMLGPTVENQWIVREGVKAGERVIVEGLQKVRPGTQVDPKQFHAR
jgi:membrane fusion protein (multidrug efflux system)